LGIGGIGKSTLAVKLGLQVQSEFEVVMWRSLQNAPPVEEYLTSILQCLLWTLRLDMVVPKKWFAGNWKHFCDSVITARIRPARASA